MGFRFRRGLKILPGVRLNFGKTGFTSVSVGGRGNSLNFSKKGTRHTIGIPGTGLSYSRFAPRRPSPPRVISTLPAPEPTVTHEDLERFDVVPREIPPNAGRAKWLVIAI